MRRVGLYPTKELTYVSPLRTPISWLKGQPACQLYNTDTSLLIIQVVYVSADRLNRNYSNFEGRKNL
jgi:hypothetical protein